jgi:hypothetical protein
MCLSFEDFSGIIRPLILDNLKKIRYALRVAAQRSGRDPDRVGLVAVTKYASVEQIHEAIGSGLVEDVGESRIQDAEAKKLALGAMAGRVRWRLIGHLQSNKARKAAEYFDTVDSLDSLRTAEALERALAETGKIVPVLIQVKLSSSEKQSGIAPADLEALLQGLQAYPHLKAGGLMAIAPRSREYVSAAPGPFPYGQAPQVPSPEEARPHFRRMRELFDRFFAGRPEAQLSMGMSGDYEVAVEEGATLVRLGSVIFGG